jgi:CheY-like chemotaxis protein
LIVDDDIRNIYALSSALTKKGASILTAFNGIEALEVLKIIQLLILYLWIL